MRMSTGITGEDTLVAYPDSAISPHMTISADDGMTYALAGYYTDSVTLGAQDRMALLCV